jgi:diketogulonate reductase-like aldo/keto reductase
MNPRRRALLGAMAGVAAGSAFPQQRTMLSRPIPSTGEPLPVVGVGTWQTFDVGNDAAGRARLREVVQVFAQAGARVIDSSPMYGTSESVAGDLIRELAVRDRLFVATKVWTSGRAEGIRQMETSFQRLRVERMDLMQVHNLLDVEVHTKSISQMKDKGRVRYMGITHYTSSAYAEVERWLKTGQYDFLQINYSLAEREAEKRLLPLAQELKTAVLINRPFAEGALFRKVKGRALPPWAAEIGVQSWAQYFLKWIVSHPAVTCAIPGTAKPEHMLDNLAAASGALADEATRRKMQAYFDSV